MLLEVGVGEEEEVVEGVKKEVGVKSQQEEVKKVVQEAKKVEEEVEAVKEAEEEAEVGEEGEGEESKVNVPQILTVLLLTPLALNGAFANVRLISLVTRIAGGKAEEVVVVEVVEVVAAVAEAVVAEAVVVEEVEVEKGCVHLMGIAPLRILYVPNGVSASAPHTSPEGQTAGARVEGEEEVGEPVALMRTVLPQTPSARNGASVSVLNTSLGTLSAILELHRGSLV